MIELIYFIGGASNTGCLVLKNEGFSDTDLIRLSELIHPKTPSGLFYYPLSGVGERFPISDPHKQPVLSPKPLLPDDISNLIQGLPTKSRNPSTGPTTISSGKTRANDTISTTIDKDTLWRKIYLHGILEGIARIEKNAYDALNELGATPVTEVFTSGGGSKNKIWTEMRENMLNVPTKTSANVEASYGCALLGLRSLKQS